MLTHVVLMTFTDAADAAKAKDLLEGLVDAVPEISALTVHLDELHTPVSAHLCLVTTHTDAAGLAGYQAHPAHLELAQWLRPRLAARTVVDYTS
ncbi:Dabb family protein [Catellatospora tritici]|uniref:Dabb family protein n=1 Tax=Catellatospora tritici TaxID=2851566 RepID=UPI001C2D7B01|nr:Dabb family protein [Catellatospora tritici]MBV1852627.1 Dabb family protein [Catellatospora tritici]